MARPVKCTVGGFSERRYETDRKAGGRLHWHDIDSSNGRSVYSPHFMKVEVEVEVTYGEALSPIRPCDVMQSGAHAAMNGTGTYTGKVPPKLRQR